MTTEKPSLIHLLKPPKLNGEEAPGVRVSPAVCELNDSGPISTKTFPYLHFNLICSFVNIFDFIFFPQRANPRIDKKFLSLLWLSSFTCCQFYSTFLSLNHSISIWHSVIHWSVKFWDIDPELSPTTCFSFAFLFCARCMARNCSRFHPNRDVDIYEINESLWASAKKIKEERKQDTALPSGSPPPGMQHDGANFVVVLKTTEATGQLGSHCSIGEIWLWRAKSFWRTWFDWITCCSHPKAVLFGIVPFWLLLIALCKNPFSRELQLWHEYLFCLPIILRKILQNTV